MEETKYSARGRAREGGGIGGNIGGREVGNGTRRNDLQKRDMG